MCSCPEKPKFCVQFSIQFSYKLYISDYNCFKLVVRNHHKQIFLTKCVIVTCLYDKYKLQQIKITRVHFLGQNVRHIYLFI